MALETGKHIMEEGIEVFGRYYGIYRGIVVNNDDYQVQNRVKVFVPSVQGVGVMLWALPRNQAGTLNAGFKYLTPRVGDTVYVTFEDGDPAFPLWEYHSWSLNEIPNPLSDPQAMGFRTPNGNECFVNDEDGVMWVRMNGAVYLISEDGIKIKAKNGIEFNGGENGGLVNIQALSNKLNQLVSELESLKALYNAHVHASPGTPPSTLATTSFSKFNASDFEDKNILH